MKMTGCRWVPLLVVWLWAVAPGYAAIPQEPGATTKHDLIAPRTAYFRRSLTEAYQQVGKRDPAWDAQAEEFLDSVAELWGADTSETEAVDTAVRLGDAAVAAGCDDPMVLYVLARVGRRASDSQTRAASYNDRVLSAPQALADRGYPAGRVHTASLAAQIAIGDARRRNGEGAELGELARDSLVRMLQDAKDPVEQRIVADWLNDYNDWAGGDELRIIREKLEQAEGIDPWLKAYALGNTCIELAWAARGGGWASTVTETGWRSFAAYLDEARKHLTQAWEIDASRPEPAWKMIAVAMGSSERPEWEMRRWFNRAVSAQIDFLPAYNALFWGMQPRWHGSHEAMFAIGVECVETERYDTWVPWRMIEALDDIREDGHNRWGAGDARVWRELGAYPYVKRVIDGYQAQPEQVRFKGYQRTIQLGFAVACEAWDEAKAIYDSLGGELDAEALGWLDMTADEIVSGVASHRGPWADAIQSATSLERQGKLEAALAAFEALEKEALDEPMRRVVRERVRILRWRLAFDRGEAVPLTMDNTYAGWRAVAGFWDVEADGAIVGTSTSDGLTLLCTAPFGWEYELSGTVEFGKSQYKRSRAFVVTSAPGLKPERVVLMDPVKQQVGPAEYHDWPEAPATFAVPGNRFAFRVQVRRGVVDVWIDGTHVVKGQTDPRFPMHVAPQVGIGGWYWWEGTVLRFRDLTIRSLAEAPAPPVERDGPPPAPR